MLGRQAPGHFYMQQILKRRQGKSLPMEMRSIEHASLGRQAGTLSLSLAEMTRRL